MNIYPEIVFPKIQQSVSNFLYEEEANISRGKLLMIGSLMVVVGILINPEGSFAAHRSHSSHSSHRSHSSHSSHSSSSYGGSVGGAPDPTLNPAPVATPSPSIAPSPTTQIPQTPPLTPVPLD